MFVRILLLTLAGIIFCGQAAYAGTVYPFKGEIDFVSKKLNLEFNTKKDSRLLLGVRRVSPQKYDLRLIVERLRISLFDISTEVNGAIEVSASGKQLVPQLKGSLQSQYTLLNHKPIRELSGNFFIKNSWLYLNRISFGNLALNGKIALNYPFSQEMSLVLSYVPLDQFLDFWVKNKTFTSEGSISGEIKSYGDLKKLSLRGNLTSGEGFIKNLAFNNIQLNIQGVYPLMQIDNSVLSQADGMIYSFKGPFDLSRKKEFKNQIKELIFSPIVDESGSDLEWTIKRVEDNPYSSIELKYLLRNEKGVGSNQDEESGMLGIERKVKF